MTSQTKPGAPKRRSSSREPVNRSLLITLVFGGVVALGILAIAGVVGYSWYSDHLAAVIKVNGTEFNKDQVTNRALVDVFRLNQAEATIRDWVAAGRITTDDGTQRLQYLEQQRSSIASGAPDELVDETLYGQLAASNGVSVTDQEVQDALTKEATTAEYRHVWLISVKPEVSTGATAATDAQVAAAQKKADELLAQVKGGKAFDEVAKASSSDSSASSGGDLGWITSDNTAIDANLLPLLFKLDANGITDVVKGTDGSFLIGRVTEITPQAVDNTYSDKITKAGIPLDTYKSVLKAELLRKALEKKVITDPIVSQASTQRSVQQIFIQASSSAGQDTGTQVHVEHILYSPNGDPNAAASLDAADPAWEAAKAKAQATFDKFSKDPTQFEAIAKTDSNDTGTAKDGGLLPWVSRSQLDTGFGDAVFASGLQAGQIIGPVKSAYGYHVIKFLATRAAPQDRAAAVAAKAAAPGADFAQLAKDESDGSEASKGGDLGWVAQYQLAAKLNDAIFSTAVGSVSSLVQTSDGFYIFKINDEQSRELDTTQKSAITASGFSNWYDGQKSKATIWKDASLTSTAA